MLSVCVSKNYCWLVLMVPFFDAHHLRRKRMLTAKKPEVGTVMLLLMMPYHDNDHLQTWVHYDPLQWKLRLFLRVRP
jgi:hypothetical protein